MSKTINNLSAIDLSGFSKSTILSFKGFDNDQLQAYITEIQSIKNADYGDFGALQMQEYANALSELEPTQAAVLLSTQGLTNAQIQQTLAAKGLSTEMQYQAMAEAGLLSSSTKLTNTKLQSVLATQLESDAKAEEVMTSMGLTVAKEGEDAVTVKLTAKKLQEAVASGVLTEAQAQELAMTLGVTRRILVDWDKYYKNTNITQVALVDLTYLTLNEWAHNLIKKYSLTKKQYYNMSIIMRQCLDYACEPELNLLKDNPFRRVRIKSNLFTRKEKPKSNTQVFIVDEQKKICDTAKKKIAEHPWCTTPLMILLNFQLGLRISEICAIKWSDVEDNYIHIQRMEVEDYTIKEIDGELKSISNGYTIVPYTKSVAGDRKVYLNDSAKKILRQIKKTNMEYGYYDQDFIFIKSQGCVRGTTSAFSQYLTDLCVEAGVMKKSSHKIRKTYISSLFDQKININTIREQAGHEDEQTSLNNYCFDQNIDRVIEDKLEHAANKNVCI